jgi:hypothetical protein
VHRRARFDYIFVKSDVTSINRNTDGDDVDDDYDDDDDDNYAKLVEIG